MAGRVGRIGRGLENGRRRGHYSAPALRRELGLRSASPVAVIEAIEAGFPYATLERLQSVLQLGQDDFCRLVAVPPRTLLRRKSGGRLLPDESERVLRLFRVYQLAVELFEGDQAAARRWLSAPRAALGGRSPLEMARIEVGAREVEDLIGRLEHGVFS